MQMGMVHSVAFVHVLPVASDRPQVHERGTSKSPAQNTLLGWLAGHWAGRPHSQACNTGPIQVLMQWNGVRAKNSNICGGY